MPKPNALVTVEKGEVRVDVLTPKTIVEVRNYDRTAADKDAGDHWIDKRGRPCTRYHVSQDISETATAAFARDLTRFAADLHEHTGLAATVKSGRTSDDLHVLTINSVDFYFYADGVGYDGWGKYVHAIGAE